MDLDARIQLAVQRGVSATDFVGLRTMARLLIQQRAADLQCMQHPLGFYHISLFRQAPVTLRLHYWPSLRRPPSSAVTPYHDHVWNLQSCVLVGRIENIVLSLKYGDHDAPYVVASIQQVNGVDMVVPTSEKVTIEATEMSPQSAGESYSIAPRTFHYTNVSLETAAVTIVRAEVVIPEGPRTLVPVGYSGQAPSRTYLSKADNQRVLRELEELLSED